MPRVSNDELSSYLDGVRERDLPMLPREASVAWDLLDARRELAAMTAKAEWYERALRVAIGEIEWSSACVGNPENCDGNCGPCYEKYCLKQAEQAENVAEVADNV